ncbi:acyl-CoA thioesterase [Burkholderiaceae bacterium DAT-1]|nr:acyl-CoA thioesterase [Burkholderiaceae bacterium DAT-1]
MNWDYPSPFTLQISPAMDDIDGLNHTNNAVYVKWCESAGWAHSRQLGMTVEDYRRLDRAMAIRKGEYDYIQPTSLGDALILGTWLVAGHGRLGMTRVFQMIRASDQTTVLRAKWDLVCIEISTGKPKRLPDEFRQCYESAVIRPISVT